MPLHIENLISRVHTDPNGPQWNEEQVERIVELVVARLERDRRLAMRLTESTSLRHDAGRPDSVGE